MKSSPELPLLAGVALAGEGEGALDLLAVDGLCGVRGVLLDHGKEVTEQGALIGGELAGDRIRARRARLPVDLADPGMAAAILLAHGAVAGQRLTAAGLGYACALAWRNRMASWCLATQAP